MLGNLRITEKEWLRNYFHRKYSYGGNLETLIKMAPELFPPKLGLLWKHRIIAKKWHQNYLRGKYAYCGNIETLIRNGTRTIFTEIMPTGET